jgi:hypothetical protein
MLTHSCFGLNLNRALLKKKNALRKSNGLHKTSQNALLHKNRVIHKTMFYTKTIFLHVLARPAQSVACRIAHSMAEHAEGS